MAFAFDFVEPAMSAHMVKFLLSPRPTPLSFPTSRLVFVSPSCSRLPHSARLPPPDAGRSSSPCPRCRSFLICVVSLPPAPVSILPSPRLPPLWRRSASPPAIQSHDFKQICSQSVEPWICLTSPTVQLGI